MKGGPAQSVRTAGFTLVEMLVSSVVLVLLVVMVTQLTNGATTTTTNSRKHLDADNQARLIFDRMAIDFNRMVKRPDADCIFAKQAGNDTLFFYSEGPAYYNSSISASAMSKTALVGYRINSTTLQLERLGKGLSWDGTYTSSSPGAMVLLTYLSGSATPDPASTLAGNWGGGSATPLGTGPTYNDGTDADYHVLGDQTYRLEISFLLNDGTISQFPITNPTTATNQLNAPGPPTGTSDSAGGYAQGSRWYDTTSNRGYYCTNATAGAAIWSPIGVRDLSAIIVAIAVLDNNSRALLMQNGQIPNAIASQMTSNAVLPDSTSGSSTAQAWLSAVNSTSFAHNSGIPQSAASQVRIYQRYFHLNYK